MKNPRINQTNGMSADGRICKCVGSVFGVHHGESNRRQFRKIGLLSSQYR